MASGKRASMREGPLAQLFRKTEEDGAPAAEPKAGRPLPEGGPAPQATQHLPEPQAHQEGRVEEPTARPALLGTLPRAARRSVPSSAAAPRMSAIGRRRSAAARTACAASAR